MRLALKYRPRRIKDVVGQEVFKVIFTAMLKKFYEGKSELPSAFLFEGSRGVGKTSSARIVAAALNCPNAKDMEPCGECAICKPIFDGCSMSVLEVDGASSGLVDDIRAIKEMTMYSHSGKFRVIYIDEVHSLSREAFNALLKILEEPPSNTLFIFTTTEAHKIPETIISRTISFEFKRLTIAAIIDRLAFIAKEEGITVNNEVLEVIAEYVEGGMRDAIMILEQLAFYKAEIDVKSFEDLFGIIDSSVYEQLMKFAVDGKYLEGISLIRSYFGRISDGMIFVDGFIDYIKEGLLYKFGINKTAANYTFDKLTPQQILDILNHLWDLKMKTRYANVKHRALVELVYALILKVINSLSQKETPHQTAKATPQSVRQMFT